MQREQFPNPNSVPTQAHPLNSRHDRIGKLVHDLRGPLTSLQLGLETVIDMSSDPDTKPFLDQMLLDVHRLAAQLAAASDKAKTR